MVSGTISERSAPSKGKIVLIAAVVILVMGGILAVIAARHANP